MSRDFFDRLDAELADLTRHGAHLSAVGAVHHRARRLMRRALVVALLAVALAAALISEFPAAASGHAELARAPMATRL